MIYIRNWNRESKCFIIYRDNDDNKFEHKCRVNSHGRLDWVEIDGKQLAPSELRRLGIRYVFYDNPVMIDMS